MKYFFHLHHPAHFHLFKNIITALTKNDHEIYIFSVHKDILQELLDRDGVVHVNILPWQRKKNRLSMFYSVVKQDLALLKWCIKKRPNILVGTSTEITHVGRLLGISQLFLNEDDVEAVPLLNKATYPFAKVLLVPDVCSTGKWKKKTINYAGYHELAYLHPNHFTPEKAVVTKNIDFSKPFFLIRFSQLSAHHDVGKTGITNDIAQKIIKLLKPYGNIYISSERPFDSEFEQYRLKIDPLDIHHSLFFATMYIGDSQTMTAEAAVLGTPAIRFNDFVGKLGYLEELEHKYGLTFGIRTSEPEKLFVKIDELLKIPNLKEEWQKRRRKMLDDKIDVTAFMVWFIEHYPHSAKVMRENPSYHKINLGKGYEVRGKGKNISDL